MLIWDWEQIIIPWPLNVLFVQVNYELAFNQSYLNPWAQITIMNGSKMAIIDASNIDEKILFILRNNYIVMKQKYIFAINVVEHRNN